MRNTHRLSAAFTLFLLVFLAASAWAAAPATIRLDYYHSGNASHEMYSFDRFVVEPLPWPGNPNRPVDDTNRGKYLFEVRQQGTSKVLYSRGFASIYGEWETTDEAKTLNRTFGESFRFPDPQAPVQLVLKKRDAQNNWVQVWSVNYDPKDIFTDRSKPSVDPGALITIEKHGDSASKVDFLILGDGYKAAERGKCEKDARRLTEVMFSTSPFKERRTDFNVWALCPAAAEAGISRPSTGVYRHSPLGTSYDTFASERYVLTVDNKALREIASFAPYEFMEIITNSNTYGGGGIFGLYSTVAADSGQAPYIFVHEFGHHFAGLADEYYTSDVAYNTPAAKVEPWEPNVTAMLNPQNLKWKSLVEPGTPLPTPWGKEAFEAYEKVRQAKRSELRKLNRPEAEMEALFAAQKKHEDEAFGAEKYGQKVGAFEGANYEATGYYRPQINCIMFTRTPVFCRVCQQAIERMVDLYTK